MNKTPYPNGKKTIGTIYFGWKEQFWFVSVVSKQVAAFITL